MSRKRKNQSRLFERSDRFDKYKRKDQIRIEKEQAILDEIDPNVLLMILKCLHANKLLNVESFRRLFSPQYKHKKKSKRKHYQAKHKALVQKRNYTEKEKLSKSQLRSYWIYLMNNHQLFCDICGKAITVAKDITYDHKIPRSMGGPTNEENGKPAHKLCNNLKSNIMPDEWEQVGHNILRANGITIDLTKCGYKYPIHKIHQHHR